MVIDLPTKLEDGRLIFGRFAGKSSVSKKER
jgi:hypothetical protein